MPQAARVPETVKSTWLRWEVVEDTPHGPYVIAKFDTDADAERFLDSVGRRLTLRLDPSWVELMGGREVRRPVGLQEPGEVLEP